jgi:predicted phosphate transport protein (TIGR00153 family)
VFDLKALFFRRQQAVEDKLENYLHHWKEGLDYLEKGLLVYLEEGPGDSIDYFYSRVGREESRGDDVRREVEAELYRKALLPEARGDILRVLEAMDRVINRAESTVRQLVIERLELEPWLRSGFALLVEKTKGSCDRLYLAAECLLKGNDRPVEEHCLVVRKLETRCDHVREGLLGKVFASDLELSRKLQLKDFIDKVASISDQAEKASDQLFLVSIKRRV